MWAPLTELVFRNKKRSLNWHTTIVPSLIRYTLWSFWFVAGYFCRCWGQEDTWLTVPWDMSRNSVPEAWNKACAEASTCHLEADQAENLLNLLQIFAPLKPVEENAGGVRPLVDHPDGFMVASCHWKDVGNALSNCANQVSSAPRAKIPKSICCTIRSWPDRVLVCRICLPALAQLLKLGAVWRVFLVRFASLVWLSI